MRSIESRFVIRPSNISFSGVYGCTFQPGNFACWGSERVNLTHFFFLFSFLLGRTVPKSVFSKSETLSIFKAFAPHGDAKNAGTQAGCKKTSQKLNGGRMKGKKAVSIREGLRVQPSVSFCQRSGAV